MAVISFMKKLLGRKNWFSAGAAALTPPAVKAGKSMERANPRGGRYTEARLGALFPMIEPKQLEDLATRLGAVIPPGLRGMKRELEDNFRAVLRANLEKWDLVSREHFDVQAELLARTQGRLAALEKRLKALEKKLEPGE